MVFILFVVNAASLSSRLVVPAPGSDSGLHQTPGSAAQHDSPVRYSPEARTAVPHLNTSLDKLCKNICAPHVKFVWIKDNKWHKEEEKNDLMYFYVGTLQTFERVWMEKKPFGCHRLTLSFDQYKKPNIDTCRMKLKKDVLVPEFLVWYFQA